MQHPKNIKGLLCNPLIGGPDPASKRDVGAFAELCISA